MSTQDFAKPQFIHREVPFFGNSENFFGGPPMKSQSLSMNNITYIYKHIKSGNGRNVFRVCLKIL